MSNQVSRSLARDSPVDICLQALDAPLDLSKADGVYVDAVLTSDADVARRAWKLTLRTAASRSEIVYSAEWAPRGPDGVGGPTFVPFSDFKLVRGPRIVEGAPPLNATQCENVYGFGLTLSRFGAASVNMTEVENFRDGPFAVKLNAVGVYGAEKVDVPTIGKNVQESKPNSAGRPSTRPLFFMGDPGEFGFDASATFLPIAGTSTFSAP